MLLVIEKNSLNSSSEDWRVDQCTHGLCVIYFKEYVCKHLIGIVILLNKAIVQAQAKTIPIAQKRKPGRPRLAVLHYICDSWFNTY